MAGSSCWQELKRQQESGELGGGGRPAGRPKRARGGEEVAEDRSCLYQPRLPPASQDGGVELLDLLSQPPGLLLHLTALLLQLGDVLHGLLQRDGVAGLQGARVRACSTPGAPTCQACRSPSCPPSPRPPQPLTSLVLLEIKLFRVSKPILMLKRLFCSAEMCFICRFCWGTGPSLRHRAPSPSPPAAGESARHCATGPPLHPHPLLRFSIERDVEGGGDRELRGSRRRQEGTRWG